MSTEWRRKTYYNTRVLISTERVLDPQFADGLICITGAEQEMLRNLTQYLRRRSTFSESESETGYLAPDTADWDTIQAIVADLEEKLMGCEELMQLFSDMLTQLECVCTTNRSIESTTPALTPIIDDYLTDGTLIPTDIYGPDTAASAKRCAIAQLTYQQMWDVLTIYLQPFQETSADVMLGIILGAFVVSVGIAGLSIPAATIVAVMLGLADMAVEGSLTSVRNALDSNQDELICALYRGLQTDYASAQAEARVILDGIETLTYIDKVVLGQLFAPWAIWLAATAWDEETVWALASVTAGACDDCDEVEGDDWWALRIPIEEGLVEFDHSGGGASWVHECFEYSLPAGYDLEGIVWVYRNKTGDCELKRMAGHDACASAAPLWDNHSSPGEVEGRYFAVQTTTIDWEQCKAVIAPYATNQPDVYSYDNEEDVNVSWDMGWSCTGTAEAVVEWLVFSGSAP